MCTRCTSIEFFFGLFLRRARFPQNIRKVKNSCVWVWRVRGYLVSSMNGEKRLVGQLKRLVLRTLLNAC